MTKEEFENYLNTIASKLRDEARETPFAAAKQFEQRVREITKETIDIHDFCDVFLAAIHDPRAPDGVNLEMATRSFSYAKRSIAERRKIYGVPSTIPFPVSRTLGGEG